MPPDISIHDYLSLSGVVLATSPIIEHRRGARGSRIDHGEMKHVGTRCICTRSSAREDERVPSLIRAQLREKLNDEYLVRELSGGNEVRPEPRSFSLSISLTDNPDVPLFAASPWESRLLAVARGARASIKEGYERIFGCLGADKISPEPLTQFLLRPRKSSPAFNSEITVSLAATDRSAP